LTPDRWQQVKTLFESALALDATERSLFLDANCMDAEIRSEVESLLNSSDETGQFLEDPVASLNGFEVENSMDTEAIGMRVGPWELVQEIGRGGMGTVYLAIRADQEFKKRVAIKLISHGMENDFAIRRFRNERQILAKLEHPNIARLIDGGTTAKGLPYFVMEYVEGEPLHRYCDAHSLPPAERIAIFLKACSAVHYAHRRMIIHRDLKPGNILVKKDGTPKLLDFGIAKLLDPDVSEDAEITMVGARIVTPAYASPEQMRGEPATVASDIYALGVVLFELLTGRRPAQDPAAFDQLDPSLRRVIAKATRHKPEERYDSVEVFAAEVQRSLEGKAAPNLPDTSGTARLSPGSVAVLPFRLLHAETSSDAYLGIGITDAVVTKLSNVGRISVRPTSAVMRYAEVADATAAGRELNVEFVVEGRVQKNGNRVRATVQLVRVRSGTPVWAGNFDEELEDLLKVEDSISGQVAHALIPQLTGEEREQLARRGTASVNAHQAYLRGRWHWSQHTEEGLAKALVCFMQAIAEDPAYAQAHAGVADYYIQLGTWGGLPPHESFAAARQAANRALEIDPSLPEAHASLGFATWAYDRDYAAAAHEFQLAIALNPDYATAHHWFGLLNSARGKPEMAIASLERARKLDPNHPILSAALALAYYNARQFDRSIAFLGERIQALGDVAQFYELLAWNQLAKGMPQEALEAAHRAAEVSGRSAFSLSALAHAQAALGNRGAAHQLLKEVESRTETRYISGYLLASFHLAAGNRRECLDWLERAWADRDWWVMWVATGPSWDQLRGDPRFIRLVSGAPEPAAPIVAGHRPLSALGPIPRRALAASAAFIAVLLALLIYLRLGVIQPPFQKPRIAKLTTNGTALMSAVSPDGAYVVYSSHQGGHFAIYVRTVTGSAAARLAGPFESEVYYLQFTRKGTHIAYAINPPGEPNNIALYVVPLTGGMSELLVPQLQGPAAISPDGGSIAFYRGNPAVGADELVIADSSGAGERVVARRRYPDRFAFSSPPSWSPDNRRIAAGVEGTDSKGFRMAIVLYDTVSSALKEIRSPRWQYVGRMAWNGARGLLVIGQEQDASFQQIWFVPLGRGEFARLTNDLNDYSTLGISADGTSLVAVQQQTLSNVYLQKPGRTDFIQITPGSGRYFDLAWAPDGRIGYASDASGSADIWIMNADGTNQRQLTTSAGRSYSPAFSPDGKTVAYHSNRGGNWNIWKMDTEGRNHVQLTHGTRDSNWPAFTPDGANIVYHHTGLSAMFNVWRVPTSGGEPVQLNENLTLHPAVSRKDGRIACWYSENLTKPNMKLAVLPPGGGAPLRLYDISPSVSPDGPIRWNADSTAITYIDTRAGVRNLWLQPVEGGPPRPITNFTWGEIYSFDWRPDGTLAYSRGMSSSDVVLIRENK
jgi:serine/threonine protein kinase/Tol biopolymer transport system component/tetratricopeptide (TPR) repeat protein